MVLLPIENDERVKNREGSVLSSPKRRNRVLMLQTQELSVVQEKEPCIGFTQKNSIENSV